MANRVQRARGTLRGRSRTPAWLGWVGSAALCAAGCGGSVEGTLAKRGGNTTSSTGTSASSSGTPSVLAQGGTGPVSGAASAADAVAAPLPSSDPPLSDPPVSYPAIVGSTPPPPDPSPPPPAPPEPPRPTTPAPAVVVVPPNDCHFDYLGDWVVCENAGWPNVTASSAPDLVGCMQECLQHDDCSAVTDYFWLGIPDLGCFLYTSSCDAPVNHPVWAEEDGGRDYRRGACGAAPDAGH